MIPLCDLQQQYVALKDEIDSAMQQVAANAQYILGPNVRDFEQEMAEYCGCKYAVGVGSGTDALHLSLRALGIGPGDEVITTPFTFIGTTEAIGMVGAKPVFVDIDPQTFNLDVSLIEEAISPRTKAIMPVHLYGQPCDMAQIVHIAACHKLDIVEDCAQAIGASYHEQKVGTFGKSGCFSFFPSKNLGCFGDGGMVVTNNSEVYERVEMLRRHGSKKKYYHRELGLNSRLDELQAAILRVKLRYLDAWNKLRRKHAYRYNRLFSKLQGVQRPKEISLSGTISPIGIDEQRNLVQAVYHQYTILVDNRVKVQAGLEIAGIGSAVYYPVPLHLQEVHRELRLGAGSFPVAERISKQCMALPIFPELTEDQQQKVNDCLVRTLSSVPSRQFVA